MLVGGAAEHRQAVALGRRPAADVAVGGRVAGEEEGRADLVHERERGEQVLRAGDLRRDRRRAAAARSGPSARAPGRTVAQIQPSTLRLPAVPVQRLSPSRGQTAASCAAVTPVVSVSARQRLPSGGMALAGAAQASEARRTADTIARRIRHPPRDVSERNTQRNAQGFESQSAMIPPISAPRSSWRKWPAPVDQRAARGGPSSDGERARRPRPAAGDPRRPTASAPSRESPRSAASTSRPTVAPGSSGASGISAGNARAPALLASLGNGAS